MSAGGVRPRLVGARPKVVTGGPPRPVGLQANWERILGDLTELGVVEVEVGNGLASLHGLCEPWSAWIDDGIGTVSGPGIGLIAAIDGLASGSVEYGSGEASGRHRLRWFDWSGTEIFRLGLTDQSNWSCFRARLVWQWSQRAGPRPVCTDPDARVRGALLRQPEARFEWCASSPVDAWHRPQTDAVLQAACRQGRLIDPTLIPPFLEVIGDQACGLRVMLGNGGVLLQHETDFYTFRIEDGRIRMRGSTGSFELQQDAISHVCVVHQAAEAGTQRCIQLFDDERRCIATLAGPIAANGDSDLWRTLVDALLN